MGKPEEVLVNPLDELNFDEKTEETTLDPEEDKDNSQNDDEQEEEVPEKVEEEVKVLSPKEKRHKEQETWSKAEVTRLRNLAIEAEVKLAKVDANNLIELSTRDPKLADEVARRFDYDDMKDAKEKITWVKVEYEKPTEEDLDAYYQSRKSKEEHESWLLEAKLLLEKLPTELQEEAINEFNELIEGRTLSKEKMLKFANMVTLSLNKGKSKTDITEWLKKLSSTGISNSKKPSESDKLVEVIVDGKIVLLDSKLLK